MSARQLAARDQQTLVSLRGMCPEAIPKTCTSSSAAYFATMVMWIQAIF